MRMLAALLLMVALVQGAAGACPTASALGEAADSHCAEHGMDAGVAGAAGHTGHHAQASHHAHGEDCPGGAACGGCPLIAADTSAPPAAGKPEPAAIVRDFAALSAPARVSAFEPPPPKA